MSVASKRIGGVESRANAGARTHTAEFFVLEADLAAYVPEIGDRAEWAPNYSLVSSYSKSWQGPGCWRLSVTAEELDEEDASSSTSLAEDVKKSYSVAELYLPRQWWGIRLATPQEAGYADDGSGGLVRTSSNAFLDVNGARAETAAMLFSNASRESKGAPDYSLSPFSNPSSGSLPLSLVEQKLKTKVYTVAFFTKKAINAISNFVGVSGEFSGKCRPSPSDEGKWKAEQQTLDTTRDSKGKTWVRVFRKMSMAPGDLVWDSEKNGGVWSW